MESLDDEPHALAHTFDTKATRVHKTSPGERIMVCESVAAAGKTSVDENRRNADKYMAAKVVPTKLPSFPVKWSALGGMTVNTWV